MNSAWRGMSSERMSGIFKKANMQQIIVTGSNGLIGSAFCNKFRDAYEIVPFDVSDANNPVDITDAQNVDEAIAASEAGTVVHFAAFTDVTAAWQQTDDTSGAAYKVNVEGTKNLVHACNKTNKHLICISTSYVFDGEKAEQYIETDAVNPIEWYGKTKALAEEYVQSNSSKWTVFRIDQPFNSEKATKLDIAHKIIHDLQAKRLYPQFSDHYFGPTWIPDFINAIEWSIRASKTGLYHASNGETWNNFDFAKKVAELLDKQDEVQPSSLSEYLKTSARPYQKNTALNCEKLFSEIDFKYTAVEKAIGMIRV